MLPVPGFKATPSKVSTKELCGIQWEPQKWGQNWQCSIKEDGIGNTVSKRMIQYKSKIRWHLCTGTGGKIYKYTIETGVSTLSSSANSIKKNEQKMRTFNSTFVSFQFISVFWFRILILLWFSFKMSIILCFDSKFQFFCVFWFKISIILCVLIQNFNYFVCCDSTFQFFCVLWFKMRIWHSAEQTWHQQAQLVQDTNESIMIQKGLFWRAWVLNFVADFLIFDSLSLRLYLIMKDGKKDSNISIKEKCKLQQRQFDIFPKNRLFRLPKVFN